ncbi:MAG: glucose 1-dehydrogenase [Roseibium sp.]
MTTMNNPFDLHEKVALITGGGSGLGLAMARCFVASGAMVLIAGKTETKLKDAVTELGENASYLVADITAPGSARDLVRACSDRYGGLDILVNNAGNHVKKPILDTNAEDIQTILDTHVMAAFELSREAMPVMKLRGGGSILFIASMASYLSVPQVIGYTVAKSAVLGLVRGVAAEVSLDGIRVNGIAPGWIETPMTAKALDNDPARKNKILTRTPMGKMGKPEDIGWAATYLASDAAAFVNGHVLVVDGGALNGF